MIPARYEAKIEKLPEAPGCWVWTGSRSAQGYGQINRGPGMSRQAPRIMYELHKGPIPEGLDVLHRCDVPACVNPAHLYPGTQSENTRDAYGRGRCQPHPPRGEASGAAKLTTAQVLEIRRRRQAVARGIDLAVEFGVSQSTIVDIVRRRTWGHVQ